MRLTLAPEVTTVPIDVTNGSDPETLTLYTPASGHRFIVYHLWMRDEDTGGDVTFLSGSTALTGNLNLGVDDEIEWRNAPFPILKGRSRDDAFRVTLAGATGIQLNGYALMGDSKR